MIVGESPGQREAESGKPFIGPSGEVLDEMLASIELSRGDVFLSNILLDRTPDNRDPNKEELDYYGVYLDRLIEIIQPRVIVTLGRFFDVLHPEKVRFTGEKRSKISKLHGILIKTESHYGDLHVMRDVSPGRWYSITLLRKTPVRADFQKLTIFI